MCQIVYKPARVDWNFDIIREAQRWNPDGVGLCVDRSGRHSKGLFVKKGLWDWNRIREEISCWKGFPAMLHLRKASAGTISDENAHPFLLAANMAVAHNGHVVGFGNDNISDTRDFIGRVLQPYVSQYGTDDRLVRLLELLTPADRWIIMRAGEAPIIVNRHLWHEENGCLYANRCGIRPWFGGWVLADEWPELYRYYSGRKEGEAYGNE